MAAGPLRRILVVPLASLVWLACAVSVSAQQTSVRTNRAHACSARGVVQRRVSSGGRTAGGGGRDRDARRLCGSTGRHAALAGNAYIAFGNEGRYNVLLGSRTADGLPDDLFTTGEPRWLGVRFDRAAETEQPRVLLASVPYALKAADAETLGGKPASAYVLASPEGSGLHRGTTPQRRRATRERHNWIRGSQAASESS